MAMYYKDVSRVVTLKLLDGSFVTIAEADWPACTKAVFSREAMGVRTAHGSDYEASMKWYEQTGLEATVRTVSKHTFKS